MAISNLRNSFSPLTSKPGSHCPILYALRTAATIQLRNLTLMRASAAATNIKPFDRVRKHKNTKNPISAKKIKDAVPFAKRIKTFISIVETFCKSKTWLSFYFRWTSYILCFLWSQSIKMDANWKRKDIFWEYFVLFNPLNPQPPIPLSRRQGTLRGNA